MSTHTSTPDTSSIPSTVPGSLDDPRPAFARALALARSTVETASRSGRLDAPTPCDEMNVRELIGHLHMAIRRAAAVTSIDDPSELPTDDLSIADDAWSGAVAAASTAAVAAWTDDELLTTQMVLPWMQAPGAQVLGVYLNETLVHTWDLATATGQTPIWNDDDATLALEAIRRELPMADRAEMWAGYQRQMPPDVLATWKEPFADAVEVGDDATPIERLVAWQGRRP